MDKLITGIVVAVLFAPFLWPAFAVIYRYFRDVKDQRYERKQEQHSADDSTGSIV